MKEVLENLNERLLLEWSFADGHFLDPRPLEREFLPFKLSSFFYMRRRVYRASVTQSALRPEVQFSYMKNPPFFLLL